MRLYRTASGGWVGTQADAKAGGRGWELVEVPTDKEGLLHWLNLNARPAPERMTDEEVRQSNTPEAQREAAIRMAPVEPKAIFNRGQRLLRQGEEADKFSEWVLEAEPFAVVNVFGACIERFARIKREATEATELTGLLD